MPFLIEGHGRRNPGGWSWAWLVIGVLLFHTPATTRALGSNSSTCSVGDVEFTFTKNEINSNELDMCVGPLSEQNDATCECYSFMKVECGTGHCWRLTSLSVASKLSFLISILGGIIAMLIVVLIATTIAFIYAHRQSRNCVGYMLQSNDVMVKGSSSKAMDAAPGKPTLPLPRNPGINRKQQQQHSHNNDLNNYIKENEIQAWRMAEMHQEKGLHGEVQI